MTVNINAANISSVQLAAAQTPSAPNSGFVRLHHNANSRLAMRPATGNVVEFLGNTSGSGAGITFPATQSPSSDANTLDDYEEGTWTPVIEGSSTAGTGSYTIQQGAYTKIGRMVIQTFALTWTSHSGTGNMQVGNLLFPAGTSGRAGAFLTYVNNIALTAGNYISGMYLNTSASVVEISQTPTGGGTATQVPIDTSGSLYGVIITFA